MVPVLPELPLQEAASRRVGLRLLVGAGLALGAVLRDGAITAAGGGGKRIARVARRYKGSRYRWGGNTPRGFDCSGFTQYVVREAIKLELSQALPDQWRSGRRVGKGKWRAGDLVFFENTYKKGLSHVGIYLERGQFIHAQNEQTGVVITDIESDYYASRYRGARRLA
jgi:cell wall-associated NlpC family hydrolase